MHAAAAGWVWFGLLCALGGAGAGALLAWAWLRRRRAALVGDEPVLMRTLIDLLPDYIYAKDADGRFVLANLAVARAMGAQSPQQLIGKTDVDFYPADMAAGFRADEQRIAQTGVPLRDSEEQATNRLSGEVRWNLSTKMPLRDAAGKVVGLVGISRDIHRRKQAEEEIRRLNDELDQRVKERTAELAAERKLLRTLIDNMPDLIFAKDCESRFMLVNAAVAAGLDATPESLLGRSDFDFFPREQAQSFLDDEQRVMASGQALIGREEQALDLTTGEQRWLLTTKVPLRDDDGRIVGIVGISRDIAELRRIREELVRHRDRLQELVAERTEALEVAKERAEAASHAKSVFLANMSHELRTPLNAVLGYAQILQREEGLSERHVQGLATIQHSGEHLLALIDDILDLAKVEAGKFELYREPVQLSEFLQVIDDIVRVKAQDKHLDFQCRPCSSLPAVVGVDEKRLRQVLLNLLSNAIKFTEQGEVRLLVESVPRDGDQVRLRFEVRDSGPGIAADQLEAIFRPFEQAGEAKRRKGGTGLGLAISRQLTRLMGGELQVHSDLGRGSRFWFEIDATVLGARAPRHQPPGMITGYAGPRRTVLIADDVQGNRDLLAELMRSLGFEVTQAVDGEHLIAQALATSPHLVITDVVMPVLGGLEAIARLRGMPGLADVPVLAVSANASGSDAQRSLVAGANAFLPKPIALDSLLQRVGELLDLSWTQSPRPEPGHPSELLVPPGSDELEALHRLARFGHMRSIRERAERLGALDERYRPFAERLCAMASRFESRAIVELIERYRGS